MYITLIRLIANKAFDLAQLKNRALDITGIYSVSHLLITAALEKFGVSPNDIDLHFPVQTAVTLSEQIEWQRKVVMALIVVLDEYLVNEDASEAFKSFERALEDSSRFVTPRTATPSRSQDNSSAVTNAH